MVLTDCQWSVAARIKTSYHLAIMQFDSSLLRQCWFLAGPTACGKSEVALTLIEQVANERGQTIEVVSLDSMTLYRRMDIGTAKPTAEDRRRAEHHLFDILEPSEDFSVAEYLVAAERACREIVERGHTPLFVGGTGLYLRSLLRGVFEGPAAHASLRLKMEDEAARDGADALFRRLQQSDPVTAARLHPNDLRRVIRALEVLELTGQPLSSQHRETPLLDVDRSPNVFWLSPPRDWLYHRINQRTEAMIASGWLDEVRSLLAEPQTLGKTAAQALGYKELIEHLQGGRSLSETIDAIQTRTRQFAKRQHTWFRNLEECVAVPVTADDSSPTIAQRLLAKIR